MGYEVIHDDAQNALRRMPDESVHCVVTSPPYWGLRDYGVDGQIGLEDTPEAFVARLVEVFREVRRVLRKDGTCWVNLGDTYNQNQGKGFDTNADGGRRKALAASPKMRSRLPPKNLIGIPWRVAFALQADGWCLRQDIIWFKPNPMPESVRDRCTKAHEYLFLLTKSERYFFDADAIRTPFSAETKALSFDTMGYGRRDVYRASHKGSSFDRGKTARHQLQRSSGAERMDNPKGANKRSVWTIARQPYAEAHFATFPTELVKPCILAGCPEGGTVLDPFNGSGTTGVVALRMGRAYIGIELNAEYVEMAKRRLERYWANTGPQAVGTGREVATLFA